MKTNIGHLDATAGAAGLIKTVLALHHRMLPPSLHYRNPNPEIDFADSPFYVNDRLREWEAVDGAPLRAGVSSFGIGGSNAHVILEEAPGIESADGPSGPSLLLLSARTPSALDRAARNLAGHLKQNRDVDMSDVACTLCVGRKAFRHRAFLVCRDAREAIEKIQSGRGLFKGGQAPGQKRAPEDPAVDFDADSRLIAAGRRWLDGERIQWQTLHPGASCRRIPLPTYPFERRRCWIDPPEKHETPPGITRTGDAKPSPQKQDVADWFYRPAWEPTPPAAQKQTDAASWLVFTDECGLGPALAEKLAQAGRNVITVRAGEAFSRRNGRDYTLDPREPDHHEALVDQLARAGDLPRRIVHLWSVAPDGPDREPTIEKAARTRDLGFYSLLHIARVFGKPDISQKIHIAAASGNMQTVTGDDGFHPEKAALLGAVMTIGREYPRIHCRSIDVDLPHGAGGIKPLIIEQLFRELTAAPSDPVVAFRGSRRFVQKYEAVRLEKPAENSTGLRVGGVYLITGGLGGVGLTLAEHLAETAKAKLVLIGRSAFPAKEDWGDWLAAHGEGDDVSRKIKKLQAIESKGADVLAASADAADSRRMEKVLLAARRRFGAFNGVIHSAGVPDGAVIVRRTREMSESVFAPKITGALVLDRLLRDENLDFFLLCSSLSSVLGAVGQIGYCAANAFLDAFAHYRTARGDGFTVAVNWDAWREVGMAVDAAKQLSAASGPGASRRKTESVSHPLFDECIIQGPGQERCISRLNAGRHWVLDEHRLFEGKAVLPGVACLEMALTAFASRAESGVIEIRDACFLRPLIVENNENKEVHTRLEKRRDDFEFVIESRGEAGERVEHATGVIARAASRFPGKYDIKAIESRCRRQENIRSGFPLPPEVEPAAFEAHMKKLYGPHWRNVQWVKSGDRQGLALLELPRDLAADAADYRLHPALLDMATGFLGMLDPFRDGLPFSYRRVTVKGPLPTRIYSYAQIAGGKTDMPQYDITLMDERGRVLVDIESYTLRRIETGVTSAPFDPGDNPPAPSGLFQPDPVQGLSPAEGIEVFERILASNTPQVLVSTRDLETLPERAGLSAPPPRRPEPRENPVVSPREIESILTDVWKDHLGVETIGVDDDFFELGGDSLAGIQVASKIKERLGVHLSVAVLFEDPTIAALSRHIRDAHSNKKETASSIDDKVYQSSEIAANAIPSTDSKGVRDHEAVTPGGGTDDAGAENWETVLHLENTGFRDRFPGTGEHTRISVHLSGAIGKRFGVPDAVFPYV